MLEGMASNEISRRPCQLSLRKRSHSHKNERSGAESSTISEMVPGTQKAAKASMKAAKASMTVGNVLEYHENGVVTETGEELNGEDHQCTAPKKVSDGKSRRPLMGGSYKEEDFSDRGIILISCLPQGFFEPQLRKFFNQFGDITALRLIRSRRVCSFFHHD